MEPMANGHLIQINGIPSSGKSSLATALTRLMPGFEILTGDDIIRRIPYQQRVAQAGHLFEMTCA